MVSAGHVGGTRDLGIVSNAADVLAIDECGAWEEKSCWSM